MVPAVFISSTVRDLQHLRDTIRDVVVDLGYNPIMSDHGEVGYLPDYTAEDSCYVAMSESQLAVLIVSKRYSTLSDNGASVTENEYRSAIKKRIPIIALVDREVMAFKRIFDSNKHNLEKVEYPGMDNPPKTFAFIDAITNSTLNNAITEYGNASEARKAVKQQIAHLFASLLSRRFDPLQAEVKDVLAEIKTLRLDIGKDRKRGSREYMAVFRFLLDDESRATRDLLEALDRKLEDVVTPLMKSKTWLGFLKKIKVPYFESEDDSLYDFKQSGSEMAYRSHSTSNYVPEKRGVQNKLAVTRAGALYMNNAAHRDFDGFVAMVRNVIKNADKNW